MLEHFKNNIGIYTSVGLIAASFAVVGYFVWDYSREREFVGLESFESSNLTQESLCAHEGKRLGFEGLLKFERESTTVAPINTQNYHSTITTHSTRFNFYPTTNLSDGFIWVNMDGLNKSDYPSDAFYAKVSGDVTRKIIYDTDQCYFASALIQPIKISDK